jgi:hypothetical protein
MAGVPPWAYLGLYTMAAYDVACDKINHAGSSASMGRISPYFARHASITQGLQKLSALFTWRSHLSPPMDVTHHQILEVLYEMREGINDSEDPYPPDDMVDDARARFRQHLARASWESPILSGSSGVTRRCSTTAVARDGELSTTNSRKKSSRTKSKRKAEDVDNTNLSHIASKQSSKKRKQSSQTWVGNLPNEGSSSRR